MDYKINFPKISNNYTSYEPNSQTDKNSKHGNNVVQGTAKNN